MNRSYHKISSTRKYGFTLLELLAVIGIMVLIVGISYPLFQIYQETVGVKKGLQILNQTISLAKNKTITKKVIHYLYFGTNEETKQAYLAIYMENTGNQTLEINQGNNGEGQAVDLTDGPPVPLPKYVGFFTDVSIFKLNPPYLGFLPESGLLMPPGIQLTNKEKFMDDPKGNADLGLIYPVQSPYKCIYIKLGRQRGGIDEAVFDKCPGSGETR